VVYEEREFALLSDKMARGQILDASAVTGNPLTATLLAVSMNPLHRLPSTGSVWALSSRTHWFLVTRCPYNLYTYYYT
jgi:hypothetical protein